MDVIGTVGVSFMSWGKWLPKDSHDGVPYKMAPYTKYERLMVQVFQDSLPVPTLSLDLSEINAWGKLARVFYDQYKFSEEVGP